MFRVNKTWCIVCHGGKGVLELRTWEQNSTVIKNMFCTLFTVAMIWKQPSCPSTDEWINKLWYVYTTEYYSAIKRNTFESVLMRWTNLEPIIQSELSQKEKNKYHILICLSVCVCVYIYLEGWYYWAYLQGSNGDANIENRFVDTVGELESRAN